MCWWLSGLSSDTLMRSSLGEVIVEVEQDSGGEQVWVQSEVLGLAVIVEDIVLAERPAHVQTGSVMFPGIAAGVTVVAQVTLEDLSQSLL